MDYAEWADSELKPNPIVKENYQDLAKFNKDYNLLKTQDALQLEEDLLFFESQLNGKLSKY